MKSLQSLFELRRDLFTLVLKSTRSYTFIDKVNQKLPRTNIAWPSPFTRSLAIYIEKRRRP